MDLRLLEKPLVKPVKIETRGRKPVDNPKPSTLRSRVFRQRQKDMKKW